MFGLFFCERKDKVKKIHQFLFKFKFSSNLFIFFNHKHRRFTSRCGKVHKYSHINAPKQALYRAQSNFSIFYYLSDAEGLV